MADDPTREENFPVTPATLRESAARAETLAAEIDALHQQLRQAQDEPTRRSGFRLPDAAGTARQIARDLEETAEDLARVRGRSTCRADWGVCPEHGATLRGTGGKSWCETPGCGREWGYDRHGLPCTEPATWVVADSAGEAMPLCEGHTMHARRTLIGAVITRAADPPAGETET